MPTKVKEETILTSPGSLMLGHNNGLTDEELTKMRLIEGAAAKTALKGTLKSSSKVDREKAKFFKQSMFNKLNNGTVGGSNNGSNNSNSTNNGVSRFSPDQQQESSGVRNKARKHSKDKSPKDVPAKVAPPPPNLRVEPSSDNLTSTEGDESHSEEENDNKKKLPQVSEETPTQADKPQMAKKGRPRKNSLELPPRRRSTRNSDVTTDTNTDQEEVLPSKDAPLVKDIPEEVLYNPNSLENKPKGLVDSLSKYFTPGIKRTSRTALNSLIKPHVESASSKSESKLLHKRKLKSESDDKGLSCSSGGEADKSESGRKRKIKIRRSSTASKSTLKSNQSDGETPQERKRHTSAGQSQVRSLYDGLSHLYTDCDSRLRHVPTTNYAEKRRKQLGEDGVESDSHVSDRVRSPDVSSLSGMKSPPRMASPLRLSDGERPKSGLDDPLLAALSDDNDSGSKVVADIGISDKDTAQTNRK